MDTSTLTGLINNAALLLVLGVLYDTISPKQSDKPSMQVLGGVALGAVGIAIMLTPWEFTLGVVFDTRSMLLSVGGLFFGLVPTLTAVLATGAFRLYQGGAGAWTGVGVIITSGGIGIAWRYLRHNGLKDISALELFLLGVAVHVAMLLWMLSLPGSLAMEVLSKISLPVMAVFPLGTLLLGKLLVRRLSHRWAEEALLQKSQRLETLHAITGALASSLNLDQVLSIILEKLAVVLSCDSAAIFLPEQDSVVAVAGRGLPHPDQLIGKTFPADNPLFRQVLESKQPIWLPDAQADPRFQSWGGANYVRSWLSVPLIVREELIGFLSIDSCKPDVFGPEQAALVQPFANQAAQAIENARLHEQVQRHADVLEQRVAERTRELEDAQEQLVRREK